MDVTNRTQRRPGQHRRSDQSRVRILDATSVLVAELGYEGTSLSMVSSRAGLPTGSIHWHFGTKDLLIEAALRHSFERWQAESPTLTPQGSEDLGAAVDEVIRPLAAGVRRHPTFLQMGIRIALDQRPVTAPARRLFEEYREEGFARSVRALLELLPAGLDHERRAALAGSLTRFIMAATDGLILAREMGEEGLDGDAHFEHVTAAVVATVSRAREEAASRPGPPTSAAGGS